MVEKFGSPGSVNVEEVTGSWSPMETSFMDEKLKVDFCYIRLAALSDPACTMNSTCCGPVTFGSH